VLGADAAPPAGAETQAAEGCLECRNTGYLGRVGLYELLTITPALRRLIRPDMDLAGFAAAAIEGGSRPLHVAGAEKIARGLTTVAEVVSVLPPRE
jgi:general secretion pathway protein E